MRQYRELVNGKVLLFMWGGGRDYMCCTFLLYNQILNKNVVTLTALYQDFSCVGDAM